MTDAIKPGDLVMIIKPMPCCGYSGGLGLVRTVQAFTSRECGTKCVGCGISNRSDFGPHSHANLGDFYVWLYRLKKIDPPALADETETNRELETV